MQLWEQGLCDQDGNIGEYLGYEVRHPLYRMYMPTLRSYPGTRILLLLICDNCWYQAARAIQSAYEARIRRQLSIIADTFLERPERFLVRKVGCVRAPLIWASLCGIICMMVNTVCYRECISVRRKARACYTWWMGFVSRKRVEVFSRRRKKSLVSFTRKSYKKFKS